jgi:hypothetical protein
VLKVSEDSLSVLSCKVEGAFPLLADWTGLQQGFTARFMTKNRWSLPIF